MRWYGPFRYEAKRNASETAFSINWKNDFGMSHEHGVYVLTVNTERGRGILYVGTAFGRKGFTGRLELDQENHMNCYLDGRYMLEDPQFMKRGERKRINYGLLNLELSMRGPQEIQKTKLPDDLLQGVKETHAFGIENRRTVIKRMKALPTFQKLIDHHPDCFRDWEEKLLRGMSVRTAPKAYSQTWRELNRLMKREYLTEFFEDIQGSKIGAQLLEMFEIYICPLKNKEQSLVMEGSIFQTICNHSTQWVRNFIQFGITQPLYQGSIIDADKLWDQYGVGYLNNKDSVEFST